MHLCYTKLFYLGFDNWHSGGSNEGYYDQKMECPKYYDERIDFKRSQDKEDKSFDFDTHPRESERRYV